MHGIDYVVVMFWLTLTLGAGVIAGLRSTGARFWVNDRATNFWLLVTTIVVTQVGAGAIVGIAAATATTGTGFGLVSLASTVSGFLLVSILAPRMKQFGDRFKAVTLPDLFLQRFGRKVQIASS